MARPGALGPEVISNRLLARLSLSRGGGYSTSVDLRRLARRRNRVTAERLKILLDMNLSPHWVGGLNQNGLDARTGVLLEIRAQVTKLSCGGRAPTVMWSLHTI